MKITKKEIFYLLVIVLAWMALNVGLNLLGLRITRVLKPLEWVFFTSPQKEFFVPLIVQSICFVLFTVPGYLFIRNKKIAVYTYAAFQLMILNLLFLVNLKFHGGIHFIASFHNPGLKYMALSGQYLVDILYLFKPINGNYSELFAPDKAGSFYFHWVFLVSLYYAVTNWLVVTLTDLFFREKKQKTTDSLQ
jgi:hypothetical protein